MRPLLLALVMIVIGTRAVTGRDPPVITVSPPETFTMPSVAPPPVDADADRFGPVTCRAAVRELRDVTVQCLDQVGAVAANGSERSAAQWCHGEHGCRRQLQGLVVGLRPACQAAPQAYPTLGRLLDRIAFATATVCAADDDRHPIGCDLQADLVSAMMPFPTNRSLQCSPCVKKSFGRRSRTDPGKDGPDVNVGKIRCNRVAGQYCDETPPSATPCTACGLRALAKLAAVDRRRDSHHGFERWLRACYDDGYGHSCYRNVSAVLTHSYGAVFDAQGLLSHPGRLSACLSPRAACDDADCVAVLRALIDEAGCCAPALPALLLSHLRLPCIESMIEVDADCADQLTYFVDVTVATTDSVAALCQAVSEDLATSLALVPDRITCALFDETAVAPGNRTKVRAAVTRTRSIGMPLSVPFDPDLLLSPVVEVRNVMVL